MSQEENTADFGDKVLRAKDFVSTGGTSKEPETDDRDKVIRGLIDTLRSEREHNRDLRQEVRDFERVADDKVTGEAHLAENNHKMLNVVLDNLTDAIRTRLRSLATNGVIESEKAHSAVSFDVFQGIERCDCKSLVAFQEFVVAGMTSRRTSGIPGTDFVGL